jgi:hypothetical protein
MIGAPESNAENRSSRRPIASLPIPGHHRFYGKIYLAVTDVRTRRRDPSSQKAWSRVQCEFLSMCDTQQKLCEGLLRRPIERIRSSEMGNDGDGWRNGISTKCKEGTFGRSSASDEGSGRAAGHGLEELRPGDLVTGNSRVSNRDLNDSS